MTPTNAERGREARTRLLAAANELIAELGWGAVSTRRLAERAGVRPGVVHYHFTSLPALLREAALGAMDDVLGQVVPAFAGIDDLDAGLGTLLAGLDQYSGTDPASLLFSETYLAATRDPELRERLARLVRGFHASMTAWLERCGHPAPGATATVLIAVIDGLILHKALDPALDLPSAAGVLRSLLHP